MYPAGGLCRHQREFTAHSLGKMNRKLTLGIELLRWHRAALQTLPWSTGNQCNAFAMIVSEHALGPPVHLPALYVGSFVARNAPFVATNDVFAARNAPIVARFDLLVRSNRRFAREMLHSRPGTLYS